MSFRFAYTFLYFTIYLSICKTALPLFSDYLCHFSHISNNLNPPFTIPTSKIHFYTILLHLLYYFFLTRQSKKDSHHSGDLPLSFSLSYFIQPHPNLQVPLRLHPIKLNHIAPYISPDTGYSALAEHLMSHPVAGL